MFSTFILYAYYFIMLPLQCLSQAWSADDLEEELIDYAIHLRDATATDPISAVSDERTNSRWLSNYHDWGDYINFLVPVWLPASRFTGLTVHLWTVYQRTFLRGRAVLTVSAKSLKDIKCFPCRLTDDCTSDSYYLETVAPSSHKTAGGTE